MKLLLKILGLCFHKYNSIGIMGYGFKELQCEKCGKLKIEAEN